ncbi:MAG: hypothetical protein HHJ12_03380 [Glaciimonas sp.]|nr:hypothetical protein [Glaciimonas sp.]
MAKSYNLLISLLIWSIFLHLFRNLSVAYIALQVIIIILAVIFYYFNFNILKNDAISLIFLISLCSYVILLSIIYDDEFGDVAIGLFRFSSLILTFLVALIVLKSEKIDKFWIIFSQFSALCALSLYYQFIFGPIEWFAESSERAGFARYASLAGSLTVYGVLCGMAVISSFFYFRGWRRVLLIIIIVSGGFISLQKAAIANIFLAAIGIAIVERVSVKKLLKNSLLVISVGTIALWATGLYDIASVGFKSSLGVANDDIQTDVSLWQSALDRLVELPSIVFNFYGFNRLFWGVGVFGGSGSLGYPDLPMMHNAFGDIIAIAGIPVFIAVLFYFLFLLFKACRYFKFITYSNSQMKVSVLLFFMSFLNMLFASGNFFQPVIATILWITVMYVSRMCT